MKSSFASNQAGGSKLITSWSIYLHLMLCMSMGGVSGWSYFHSNTTMDWESARDWCREHYTDMVAIQNQGEIAHLNSMLPKILGYYWIGIRKVDNVWTWVGTNKSLTDEATNWAKGEPNNAKDSKSGATSEDCVEMYIKRHVEAGMWNDEQCDKSKTALCYAAACKNDSCLHGECVETVNNHTCQCFEGFYGDTCEQVVRCDPEKVVAPAKATVSWSHAHGSHAYGSLATYSCQEGYELSHPDPMRCTAAGSWSESPTCELVRCEELSQPTHGAVECENPLGNSSYRSSCVFSCEEGYTMLPSQSDSLLCGATGRWNDSVPMCAAVQCPALSGTDNMAVLCEGDGFSYGSSCSFTCTRGYRMRGAHTTRCTAAAAWSEAVPSCERIICAVPEADSQHTLTQCSDPPNQLLPGSTCSFSCDVGSELQLELQPVIKCTEDGVWNASAPTCNVVTCDPVEVHTAGQHYIARCSSHGSFPYGTTCEFSCEEGFRLSDLSQNTMECTNQGTWSQPPPLCEPLQCSPPVAPEWGQVNCQRSLSSALPSSYPQGAVCSFTCNAGYVQEGALTTKCTQSGQWSSPPPTCTVITCPVLEAPVHGTLNCTHPDWTHASECSFACNQGYTLHGHQIVTCGLHGNWTAETPVCQAEPLLSPTAMGLAAGGGASVVGLSLAVTLLKRLRKLKGRKFSLASNSDVEDPPQHYKNSIESLI
ncbi:unnamed protein product [Gadus morhua 'NCC']